MKNHTLRSVFSSVALLATAGILSLASSAQAGGDKVFAGNGKGGFGGPIGPGSLEISDDTTNIVFKLTTANNVNDYYVLYFQVDTNASAFADTSGFADNGDSNRKAISGYDGGNRSTITFANGFRPSFAASMKLGGFSALWALTNGGANSLPWLNTPYTVTPAGNGANTYTWSNSLAVFGLPTGSSVVGKTLKVFGTLTSDTAYRANECLPGDITPNGNNPGQSAVTQTSFGTYTIGTIPVATYPVTFRVDLSALLANGNFNPAAGDTVAVSGSFNNNGFLPLTAEATTNLYSGSINDSNLLGTVENYKFAIITTGGFVTNLESTDSRSFTLAASQTLPTVFFNDLANPSHSTVPLTFSVNMSTMIRGGLFNPATDSVYVQGVWNQDPSYAWLQGVALTNSPGNTNVYTGTVQDGNYTGTFGQYKFTYVNASNPGNTVYESRANRTYNTPASGTSYPTVYFNDLTNVTLVTVSVNMASASLGAFTPDDTVTWSIFSGSSRAGALTNDPSGNTNIYSGTFPIFDAPGTVKQYKFTYAGPSVSGTVYEQLTSSPQISGNRYFTVPTNVPSLTIPTAAWSDTVLSDVLKQDTTVTFTVDMSHAVGNDSVVFDGSQSVVINGVPSFQSWNNLLPFCTQISNTSNYTYTTTIPKGSPLVVTYKYGINGTDDEAGFAQNHVRYIRSNSGTYSFPVDVFGAYGTETSFGNLAIGKPSGGTIPITWLGRPGVHLQVKSSLSSGSWTDLNATDGLSSTNYPQSGASLYFRLVHPPQ